MRKTQARSGRWTTNGWRRRNDQPPLTRRIQRVNPYFDGKYPVVSLERVLRESRVTEVYREQGGKPVDYDKLASVIGASAAAQEMLYAYAAKQTSARPPTASPPSIPGAGSIPTIHLQFAMEFLGNIPESLRAATQQPFSAAAVVYGMLCSKDAETRTAQLAELAERAEPGMAAELNRLLPMIDELDTSLFLSLADLSVRTLRRLSVGQFDKFRSDLEWLVEAGQQIDLFEYMLQRMIVRHLEPCFRPVRKTPVQYYTLKPLLPECEVLLSGLAHIGQEGEAEARAAFQQGAALLMADSELQCLPLTECNLLQIDAAINEIAQASAQLKRQILTALVGTAAADGQLQRREAELLRAIADALGMPVPPFLEAPQETVP